MLHAEGMRPAASPRSPQQRITAIAVVGGLHVLVIGAILTAIHVTASAPPRGPITWMSVPDAQQIHPQDVPVVQLTHPQRAEDSVPRPVIQIDRGAGDGLRPPPGDGGTTIQPHQTVLVGPLGIAATHTTPFYPPFERRMGHEGNVLLMLTIDPSGAVSNAVVEHSSGFDGLDRAAAQWVMEHWRYAPATRDGAAVASSLEVTVTFRLTGG